MRDARTEDPPAPPGMSLLVGETPKPHIVRPVEQVYESEMTLLVETATDPSAVTPALRAIITGLDPGLPVFDARTMDEHLRNGQAFLFPRS